MPELVDLLSLWPVVSVLASHLGLGDLIQLARVNSEYRAVLHGFPPPAPRRVELASPDQGERPQAVREDLFIGRHQTPLWNQLKARANLDCTEAMHFQGNTTGLCRYCSMPVCMTCIVRASFAHPFNVWRSRTGYLCIDCWTTGNPHRDRTYRQAPEKRTSYNSPPGKGDFCRCKVNDGWLCWRCRQFQVRDILLRRHQCVGEACSNPVGPGREQRCICLWCDLPIQRFVSLKAKQSL